MIVTPRPLRNLLCQWVLQNKGRSVLLATLVAVGLTGVMLHAPVQTAIEAQRVARTALQRTPVRVALAEHQFFVPVRELNLITKRYVLTEDHNVAVERTPTGPLSTYYEKPLALAGFAFWMRYPDGGTLSMAEQAEVSKAEGREQVLYVGVLADSLSSVRPGNSFENFRSEVEKSRRWTYAESAPEYGLNSIRATRREQANAGLQEYSTEYFYAKRQDGEIVTWIECGGAAADDWRTCRHKFYLYGTKQDYSIQLTVSYAMRLMPHWRAIEALVTQHMLNHNIQ